jgi:MFS family permease
VFVTIHLTAPPFLRPHRPPRSLREAWLALTGLSAVFLFEMLDTSILNVALPTIGRDLHASTLALSWVTNAYAVVLGGLMLVLGAVADRVGRRRVMVVGLVLLGAASLATAFVTSAGELVAVRAVTGLAAAMTTPGSMALAFRLFDDEGLRVRAITLISTVGLVGLAVGPATGGFVLAVAPWQVLLLVNVPVAALAAVAVRLGVAPDEVSERHREPADVAGGALATITIVLALVVPSLFVDGGTRSWAAWSASAATVVAAVLFVRRERSTAHPMLDLALVARPLVAGGLAYKAAAGLAVAGLGYLVTLQLQLDRGWSPAHAAVGLLPQVAVLVAGAAFVGPFVRRVGLGRAAWLSSVAVVAGLAVYALLGTGPYVWVALSLVLVGAGLRVVGVVAGMNVLTGLPADRTSVGAALVDTASQVASAVGVAVGGTFLAALLAGDLTSGAWTPAQTADFRTAVTLAAATLSALAAALVLWASLRTRATGPGA